MPVAVANVRSIVLQNIEFFVKYRLSNAMVEDISLGGNHSVGLLNDWMTSGYLLQIRSKFMGQKRDIALDPVPVTWWDHFKRDAIPTFSRWFGLKVHCHRKVLRAATVFPEIQDLPGNRLYYREIVPAEEESE